MLGRVCHFSSRMQKSFTLSSTEVEYVAMAAEIMETTYLRYIWSLYFRTATLGILESKRIRVYLSQRG